MSEDSGDKPFKPLKLTSLKAASSAAPAPVESAGSGDSAPNSAVSPTAPVAAAGTSALKPFKLAVTPRATEPESGSAAAADARTTLPVEESSPAFVTLKPLNISAEAAVPAEPDAKVSGGAVFKPLSFTSAAGAIPVEAPEIAPAPAASAAAKPVLSRAEVAPAPAAIAPPTVGPAGKTRQKRVLIAMGVFTAFLVGVGVFFLGGKPTVTPLAPEVPVKPGGGETPGSSDPVTTDKPDVAPNPVATPTAPVEPKEPAVVAPRSRKPELEAWLKAAVLSTVTSQRIALNDGAYSVNDPVNPERTLRWIGRDSVTRELLFVDNDGIVYTKPTLANAK